MNDWVSFPVEILEQFPTSDCQLSRHNVKRKHLVAEVSDQQCMTFRPKM